jgi:hypothetical protein
MRNVRSLVSLVVGLAVIGAVWWAGLPVLAVLLAVVCGLAGVLYLVAGSAKRAGDGRSETEREGNERFLRDIPPPS